MIPFRLARGFVLAFVLLVPAAQEPEGPAYCVNTSGDPAKPADPEHTCMCHRSCDPLNPREDPACKVYCRADRCACVTHCEDS